LEKLGDNTRYSESVIMHCTVCKCYTEHYVRLASFNLAEETYCTACRTIKRYGK